MAWSSFSIAPQWFQQISLPNKGLDNGRLVKKVRNFLDQLAKSRLFASKN